MQWNVQNVAAITSRQNFFLKSVRHDCLRLSTNFIGRHSFFGHIRRLLANTPEHKALKLAVDSRSGDIPHHDWNRPAGRPRTTWVRLCGTPDSLLPTHGLLPTTNQRGGRYDPQPVTRSSEWVSYGDVNPRISWGYALTFGITWRYL